VRCWGSGFYGELGQGSQEDIGNDPAETPDTFTRISFGAAVVELSITFDSSCVRLENGSVRCWGRGTLIGLPLDVDQNIGDDSAEPPGTFPELVFGEPVLDLLTGRDHRCAVLQSGVTKCWGLGLWGRLGSGSDALVGGLSVPAPPDFPTISYANAIVGGGASGTGTCATLAGGTTVRCWGRWLDAGVDTFIGDVPADTPDTFLNFTFPEAVSAIDGGFTNFCGLNATGEAICWGSGNLGQLGNAASEFLGDTPLETPETFPKVAFSSPITYLDLDTGGGGACAVLESGEMRCWGAGFGPSAENFNLGDDELASELAPYIPIRPLATD
jgi:alpha-tubulin suppressor-like RCC1 family protein